MPKTTPPPPIAVTLTSIGVIYPYTITQSAPHGTRVRTRPDTRLPGGTALAWRYDTTITLTKWARILNHERKLHHTTLYTWDTPALIHLHHKHTTWWEKHPHHHTLATQLATIRDQGLTLIAPPEHHPLVGTHPDCGGTIRANPGTTPLTATCHGCKQTLNITWWAKLLPTTGTTTLTGLIGPLALQGHTTTPEKLRRYADRGIITPIGRDHKGRRLFDVPQTITNYLAHKNSKGRLNT